MKRFFEWLGYLVAPNLMAAIEIRRLNNKAGWCWYCEWPHMGTICPIHKVKMEPMDGRKFK